MSIHRKTESGERTPPDQVCPQCYRPLRKCECYEEPEIEEWGVFQPEPDNEKDTVESSHSA